MAEEKKNEGLLGQIKDVQEMFSKQQNTAKKSHEQADEVLKLELRRAKATERIAKAVEELNFTIRALMK